MPGQALELPAKLKVVMAQLDFSGVRITERGFGKDRRYPITNGWKSGN